MNYYNLLEEIAQKGLYALIKYLETDKNLLWTKIEDTEVITIEIETWDSENYNSEFLESFEFDKFGDFIKEV